VPSLPAQTGSYGPSGVSDHGWSAISHRAAVGRCRDALPFRLAAVARFASAHVASAHVATARAAPHVPHPHTPPLRTPPLQSPLLRRKLSNSAIRRLTD